MRERSETVLADLIAIRAEQRPDLDVLTFERWSAGDGSPDEVRTYAQLHENGQRIAAALVRLGMERGDRFALMMRNHPEFVEALIAASVTGCVAVPIDPRTRGEKLAYTLRNAGCRMVLCGDYCYAAVRAVRPSVPDLRLSFTLTTGESREPVELNGSASLNEVLAWPSGTVDVRLASPDDPLQIIYTSGTTGDPKGVVFPNGRFGLFAMLGVLLGYRADDRPYTGLSLTHGNAQAVTLGPSLHMGLRAVFSRKFTKSRLWDISRRYGCTTFSMLGGMATAIYSEPPRPDDADNPVRMVIDAGMPAALCDAFERRFGVQVFEWYGAIEGGLAYKPIGVGPVGSFGKPVAGLDMRIVDEQGRECPPGVVGEIVSRPATGEPASVEYFDDPEASAKKTAGGWLRSGDMGHRDAEGWLFFDYRKGGGIRHNGDFVNTGFVEKLIAEDPAVSDVFVYGVPAASGAPGEQDVVAALVPAPGVPFSPAAIFAACRRGLESNFVPSYLQVVDEIPKTASEKPQERFLLERFDPHGAAVFTEERARRQRASSRARAPTRMAMPPSLRVPRRSDDLSDPDGRPWAAVPSALVALAPIPLVAQPTAYVRAAWRGRAYGRVWAVRAAAAHDGGRLHVRLEWPSTRGAPAEFPDAAAVYRPRDRAAPAETIGSTSAAVELWLWEDGRDGALCLEGHGPGVFRPCPAGTVSARATRGDGRWAVVITGELSAAGHGPDQDRLGVAVWDGAREERAGIGAATPAWIRLDLESRS